MALKLHWHFCVLKYSHLRFVGTGGNGELAIASCLDSVRRLWEFKVLDQFHPRLILYRACEKALKGLDLYPCLTKISLQSLLLFTDEPIGNGSRSKTSRYGVYFYIVSSGDWQDHFEKLCKPKSQAKGASFNFPNMQRAAPKVSRELRGLVSGTAAAVKMGHDCLREASLFPAADVLQHRYSTTRSLEDEQVHFMYSLQ